jgi:hypothetical protein
MAAQKFNLIVVFLVSSCAVAGNVDNINLNNQLSACTSLANTEISKEGEIPIFSFDLEVHKPIAECGCKSALGSYAVYTSSEEYKSYIIGGKIGFVASSRKYVPLSAEKNLIQKRELIVEFFVRNLIEGVANKRCTGQAGERGVNFLRRNCGVSEI